MSSAIGRIPESLIQEILARTDIVELIGHDVQLKKSGTNFSALCPFHNEKTPSFSVSATKQFYHCFGCGAHGDAIAYLIEREGFTFIEAVESLAQKVGVELPTRDASQPTDSYKPLHHLLKHAAVFFHQQWKSPSARPAIDYLKKRGLTKDLINKYAIGLAPSGWDGLTTYMLNKGVEISLLESVGLVSQNKQGGFYDKFRNRIMFPIRDIKGRVLGFGGRVLDDSKPKYLNSPETMVFHKSECLYGLYESRTHRAERVVLVEGYMDVVALAQYEISSIATLGTAVTENHLKHLFRYYNHVVFCFDGDEAGRKAAWKACVEALPLKHDNRRMDFVFLPEGEDPDTYVRTKGRSAFASLLDDAKPFSEYFFETLSLQSPPTSLDNRAHLVQLAQPYLQKLPNGIFKTMMFDKLAELKGTPRSQTPMNSRFQPRRKVKLKKILSPAQWLGVLLIRHPEWVAMIPNWELLKTLDAPGMDFLQQVIVDIEKHPGVRDGEIHALLMRNYPHWSEILASKPWELLSEQAMEEEFLGAIKRLEDIFPRFRRNLLLEKAKRGELSENEKLELKESYILGN